MQQPDQTLTKQTIRQHIQSLREQLPADVRAAHNAAIIERLLQMPEYRRAETVLAYMNFGSEFASELWVTRVLADGKHLALPRVNRHTNRLDLYWVNDPETQLEAGLWGIREPAVERCKRLNAINEVEFALLPGIAFSRNGARLGYGGGFYDKLLAPQGARSVLYRPALAVAAYSLQIVAQLPQEATDVSVEWIVTETEKIDCSVRLHPGKPE
jgi:5-formyltetrahydrofolate cyclo-ligase